MSTGEDEAITGSEVQPPSMALLMAGFVLVGMGFAAIWFTWGKVAAAASVAEQLPYVTSGGLTGLGLIILGATALNIHAKRHASAQHDRATQQLLEILRQVAARMGRTTQVTEDR